MSPIEYIESNLIELILEEDKPENKKLLDQYRKSSEQAEARYRQEKLLLNSIKESDEIMQPDTPSDFFETFPDQVWETVQRDIATEQKAHSPSNKKSGDHSEQKKHEGHSFMAWCHSLFSAPHGNNPIYAFGLLCLLVVGAVFVQLDTEHAPTLSAIEFTVKKETVDQLSANLNHQLGFAPQRSNTYLLGRALSILSLQDSANLQRQTSDFDLEMLQTSYPGILTSVTSDSLESAEQDIRQSLDKTKDLLYFDIGLLLPQMLASLLQESSVSQSLNKAWSQKTNDLAQVELTASIENSLDSINTSLQTTEKRAAKDTTLEQQFYELNTLMTLE